MNTSLGKKWTKFQVQAKPLPEFLQVVIQKNRVGPKLQEIGIGGQSEGKMEAVWNK